MALLGFHRHVQPAFFARLHRHRPWSGEVTFANPSAVNSPGHYKDIVIYLHIIDHDANALGLVFVTSEHPAETNDGATKSLI